MKMKFFCMGAVCAILGVVSPAKADVFQVYGDTAVIGSALQLTSDTSGAGYAGLYLDITTPFASSSLTTLSIDYKMITGTFGGGSPRYTLFDPTETGSVWIYFGTPLGGGSFSDPTPGVWANTGNYASLFSPDVRVYDNNFAGDGHNGNIGQTWAQFVAAQGSTTIKYITIDLDAGWQSTQQMQVNNFTVNDQTFTVSSAVPEASTWAMMLIGFSGMGFMAYRRSRKALAAA